MNKVLLSLSLSVFLSSSSFAVDSSETTLGNLFFEGNGVEQNFEKARAYYKTAAEQGDPEAQLRLAEMCFQGLGGEVSIKEGEKYVDLLVQTKDPDLIYRAALMNIEEDFKYLRKMHPLLRKSEEAKLEKTAIRYLKLIKRLEVIAEQGHTLAQARLGELEFDGNLKKISSISAWYDSASKKLVNNLATRWSISKARYYFEKAANNGHLESQLILGLMCIDGLGSDKDTLRGEKNTLLGFAWIERAALEGHLESQEILGLNYLSGSLLKRNICSACEWLEKAAEQGSESAQIKLRDIYFGEHGDLYYKPEKGLYWLQILATKGHAQSQTRLGVHFFMGTIIEQDDAAARYWYKKAAEQGWIPAQFNLADLYRNGFGGDQDYEKAFALYKEFASKYYSFTAKSQKFLAGMYRDGLGTPRDYERAAYWFSKAYGVKGERDAYKFYHHTVQKMEEKVEHKFYSRFKGNQYISLVMFDILQKDSFSYGQLRNVLPHWKDLGSLFTAYVKKLDTLDESPLQYASLHYLNGLLAQTGKDKEQVPADVLRFYAILEDLSQKATRDTRNAFDFFQHQFCPSIINCSTGKGDSLIRFFVKTVPEVEKMRYVSKSSASLGEHELFVRNYLKTSLSSILEDTLADDFFLTIMLNNPEGSIFEPAHQTGYLRSCLGHHLGLSKKHVFDEFPSMINKELFQMSPTQMLEKFFDYMTPDALCQKFKGKIDATLNDAKAAATYLPYFHEYLEKERNCFKMSYDSNDNEVYEIQPHASEKLLLKAKILREAEEDF